MSVLSKKLKGNIFLAFFIHQIAMWVPYPLLFKNYFSALHNGAFCQFFLFLLFRIAKKPAKRIYLS